MEPDSINVNDHHCMRPSLQRLHAVTVTVDCSDENCHFKNDQNLKNNCITFKLKYIQISSFKSLKILHFEFKKINQNN